MPLNFDASSYGINGIKQERTTLTSEFTYTGYPVRGNGTVAHGNASVTTVVALRAADPKRRSLVIQNRGAGSLYVGATGVNSSSGVEITSGGTLTIDKSAEAAIYCVSSATSDVRFFEELAP